MASWRLETSKRTGARYYYNAGSGKSLWHDDALPAGWAWGKESESSPKFYVHLETGRRSDVPPTVVAAPQLSFTASQTAGDDLASPPYIPDPAVRGENVPWKVRQKRDRLFSSVPEHLRWNLHVDDVSLYSITEASIAEEMTQMLRTVGGSGSSIVDANACVGGNTLSFARAFAHVCGVELSVQRARMLRHNVGLCGLSAQVSVFQGDFVSLLATALQAASCSASVASDAPPLTQLLRDSDVVFFDPPWGGPDYWKEPRLDMFLGTVDVADVVTALTFAPPRGAVAAPSGTTKPMARAVAIKAPLNYNVAGLRAKLDACGSGAILRDDDTRAWAKMQLLVVRSAMHSPPLPPSHPLHAILEPKAAAAVPIVPADGGAATSAGASVAGVKRRAGVAYESGGTEGVRVKDSALSTHATAGSSGENDDALLRQRWTSTEGAVHVAFELLLPESLSPLHDAGRALTASGLFLHADTLTGAVSLSSGPQFLSVTAAGDGNTAGKRGDRVRLLVGSGSHEIVVEGESLGCAAYTAHESASVISFDCGNGRDAASYGLHYLTLTASREGAGDSASSTSLNDHSLELSIHLPESAAGAALSSSPIAMRVGKGHAEALKTWTAPKTSGSSSQHWLPCLLRPVFKGSSLTEAGVLGSAAQQVAGPPLGLYAALGVLPGWTEATPLAGGVRSQVRRLILLDAARGGLSQNCAYVVKDQEWDSRVAAEMAVFDFLATLQQQPPAPIVPRTDPPQCSIVMPVAHYRDEKRSFLLMPDCGESLKEWNVQHKLPALRELLAQEDGNGGAVHRAQGGRVASWRVAQGLLSRLLAGLHELHARNLLYRDMHPGNVCCRARRGGPGCDITLIDLGSAVRVARTRDGTGEYRGKTRGGRWDFMPVEQFGTGRWADGGEVTLTAASDVFSAAATVLYVLSGEAPFAAPPGSKLTVDNALVHNPRRKAATLTAHVSALLELSPGERPSTDAEPAELARVRSVLLRCLHVNAAERYQTAAAALEALTTPT
jgi:16S rRNA G966 N2-methylase RsmD